MKSVRHNGETWLWNGFWGFFFLPVGHGRPRERIAREGSRLYARLYELAGQP